MNYFQKIKITGEMRYYLRDLYIFSTCALIAIILAESIIFSGNSTVDFVDRIYGYIFFIFPFFTIALIASYFYRNHRIKQTGKIRSIIRYRLTIAFIFVSILPSIPVFILSSNVVGRLVESFYRINISDSLRAAKYNISLSERSDLEDLYQKAEFFQKLMQKLPNPSLDSVYSVATETGMLSISSKYYTGFYKNKKLNMESFSLSGIYLKEEFIQEDGMKFPTFHYYSEDKCFILLKLVLSEDGDYMILGKQTHIGNEKNINNIINTENSYNIADLWKEKVPFALRLTLGLFSIGMFAVSIIVSFLLARQISRPIVELARATQRVSKGETDFALDLKEEGEMGILIESFNQMTKDLKAKKEELLHIQRVAAWKEVAQRMAHEIKNPLTPIQLSAERIRRKLDTSNREKLDEVIRTGTETIIGQVRVLEHLVKEFSEFARMPTPVLINQSLNPIIEESLNLFKDKPEIIFTTKLSKNLPEVFLDKRLFLGVVNNLIKNAVEAILSEVSDEIENPKGKIHISTRLERKFLRKSVVLSIEDSGPGIPEKLKEKIFEPYFSTKEGHGTGIGLTIVQKTVYDHHGYIYIEESDLGGCNFMIELPTGE
ncbi:MAG: HAMP domain-containing protein [Leptospiraceae bacterium]|nr:HAMP domain-containing protein [Leptospiraceae bacterium]MCP5511713.1 HAMP domain-containing protein [Leptospiraceae bacterium]